MLGKMRLPGHALFLFMLMLMGAGVSSAAATVAENGLYARLLTSRGDITARLFFRQAPMTVMNFINLAEGRIEWVNPETGKKSKQPLYQNLIFHRVRDFMIQTGDPTGTGLGNPGYVFDDEYYPGLSHDRAGILSMANRGPNTNGSQFFITRKPARWLDNHHSVFGEVVSGLDVVDRIVRGDRLERVEIIRRGAAARAFNAATAHRLAKAIRQKLKQAARKDIPAATTPLDPARIPGPDQPPVSPGNFDFLVIGHNEMPVAPKLGRVFHYDRKGALEVAARLVRLARSQGVDFKKLIARFSDMQRDTTSRGIKDSPLEPMALRPIFRLKPGQISDPVDLSTGVYIFRRLP